MSFSALTRALTLVCLVFFNKRSYMHRLTVALRQNVLAACCVQLVTPLRFLIYLLYAYFSLHVGCTLPQLCTGDYFYLVVY